MCLLFGIRFVPGILFKRCVVLTEREPRLATRPRRVLPLRLAEQAIFLPCDPGKPSGVLLGIVPADVDHRMVATAPEVIRRLLTGAENSPGIPLSKRHTGPALSMRDLTHLFVAGGARRPE